MDQRVLSILEYDKIIEKLAAYTASELGRDAALQLKPSVDPGRVQTLIQQTSEAESVYVRGGQSPIEGFTDMRMTLKRIHAALALSPKELLGIARCLKVSRTAKERLQQEEGELTLLSYMAAQLCAHRSVEEEINRCIQNEDEISDAASPGLANVRRQMRIANERVRERLNNMVKSITFQKYLQEPIVTIRNGRFVLPVKQEYRQYVPGLVHDQSGSGATLYVEPMAVVELGNEYKRLLSLEEEEIARILAGLTAMVEPYAQELSESLELLGELDLIFAKAAMARETKAVCPKLATDRQIKILQGRHPLIPGNMVVPVDVWLGGNAFSTLIITGPNTGGKTVTLKTVGLFCMMAQAGLFLPAAEGTTVSVFSSILADIGDEQSIEQSLSTFSAHMTNLVDIIDTADDESLVLLDELGAGTDPVEGAALAMSILETLHERGCLTVATTHYSEIKAFVLTRSGMENASMEFDVDRLCPTYRLYIGIPGKSNAFEISKRLGLGEDIIDRARQFLKKEDVNFEDVIQSAQSQKQRAEQERLQAQETRYELERLRAQTEQQKKRLEEEKAALRAKAREEARQVVRESKEEMERIIIGLKNLKGVDMRQVDRAIQQARDAARKQESALQDPLTRKEDAAKGKAPKSVKPGETVYLVNFGQNATVLKPADARGDIQVQAGIIKMMVNINDVRAVQVQVKDIPASARVYLDANRDDGGLSLDIRGKMVDEAIVEVDRYIDDASINGRGELSIIHGKGTGALRNGVQAYLRKHPKVKSFRLGNYGEGDAGVTVVTLK